MSYFYEMGYSAYDSPKAHPIPENNKEFRKATKDFGKTGKSNANKEFRRGWDKAQEDWNNSSAKTEWDNLWKEVCAQR